jgi:predicted RNA-binding Zn ribbon-like protein
MSNDRVARAGTMLISRVRADLCLDYANTLSWRGSAAPTEKLHDVADLLGWIETTAGVERGALRDLVAWSREHAADAAALFADAIELREVIWRVFGAIAAGTAVRDRDFGALKTAVTAAPARSLLARAGGGYAWRVDRLRPSGGDLLAPVLWSAGDLLLEAGHRLIRQCANEKCLWLFIDESKNATRRWCDMSSCGNRAKARRHYAKVKQG